MRRLWALHDDRLIRQGDEDDLPALIRAAAPTKIIIRCVEPAISSSGRRGQDDGRVRTQ